MDIWTRAFSPHSQDYRENLIRGWIVMHQKKKKWGKPTAFHSFISAWPCRCSQKVAQEYVLGIPAMYTLSKDVGICWGFMRTMTALPIELQNEQSEQEARLPFQDLLSQDCDFLETMRSKRGIFLILIKNNNWSKLVNPTTNFTVNCCLPSWWNLISYQSVI